MAITSRKKTNIETTPSPPARWEWTRNPYMYKAIGLIILAALYSPVSQLTLSPVYGSVGAGVYHDKGLIATLLLTIFARGVIVTYVPVSIGRALPTVAFWIPTLQFVLFRHSSNLGNPSGPFWTECLTYYPLAALSLCIAGQYLDMAGMDSLRVFETDVSFQTGSLFVFSLIRGAVKGFVMRNVGKSIFTTRLGLQMMIGLFYTLLIPSSLFWLSIPSIAFTMSRNVHNPLGRTTAVLGDVLALHNYTLLERRESLTGYVSVLQNDGIKFRAMRCDHSLLGGEWIIPQSDGKISRVKEPIYAIFTMLEAVRLVKTDETESNLPKRALNIGLGIGTAPAAMIAHGVDTTILELDPAVYDFATKYFDLPSNHTAQIGDAVGIVRRMTMLPDSNPPYDYIIHDVFTGGAEPVELFTYEFLSNLEALLKANGVIAINYAGDLAMPSSSLIYRTVLKVFGSCRVYREVEAPPSNTTAADFTNMVFFCTKSRTPIRFRKPTENDFLGSGAREHFLLPKFEILPESFQTEGGILRDGQTKELEKWQVKSAIGHWKVMRTVIPAAVWENW